MSTSNSSADNHLPTISSFLPVLDDLLSPDFRPVMNPIQTPLQTPTTSTGRENIGASVTFRDETESLKKIRGGGREENGDQGGDQEAAAKIQKWWKSSNGGRANSKEEDDEYEKRETEFQGEDASSVENVKHSIRHMRAEEHIRYLESELTRLKSALSAERKLRSLQYEAIRSLWSQVQKLSVNNGNANDSSIMSQSCPNGLPVTTSTNSSPFAGGNNSGQQSCTCSSEIKELKHQIEVEVGELRSLVSLLLSDNTRKPDDGADDGHEMSQSSSDKCKRPDTLDLLGGAKVGGGTTASGEELQGYADDMAKFVVERGLSDNTNNQGHGQQKTNPDDKVE